MSSDKVKSPLIYTLFVWKTKLVKIDFTVVKQNESVSQKIFFHWVVGLDNLHFEDN